MKLIFFGSSRFSIPILEILLKSKHRIECVVSTPPSQKGRGRKLIPSVVDEWSRGKNLQVLTPINLKESGFLTKLKNVNADCLIVASYGKILPDEVLAIPRKLPLNIHPSLLPKYRGAAPIARAILDGNQETGLTIAKITPKLDAGEIIDQESIAIENSDDAISVERKLSHLGGKMILKVLDKVESGKIHLVPQKEDEATYAVKMEKTMGKINWNQSEEKIRNLVRAVQPWPSAFTFYERTRIKVLKVSPSRFESARQNIPGTILGVDHNGIDVQTASRVLKLETVHPESGREMSAFAFAQGYRIKPGERLT